MASFTWDELISRAKTYCDDDHNDEKSWISDTRWLELANVEYAFLYKRWVRSGLVTPAATTGYMDGFSTSFSGVLALIGVAKDYGDFVRLLNKEQPESTIEGFWRGSTQPEGPSIRYIATGVGDTLTVELDPKPNDLTATNYIVRYIPTVAKATNPAATVELPYGTDERLVLGLARRAQLKDSGTSALLNGLIADADAETNFSAAAKLGGLKVRRNQKPSQRSTPSRTPWPSRYDWLYL